MPIRLSQRVIVLLGLITALGGPLCATDHRPDATAADTHSASDSAEPAAIRWSGDELKQLLDDLQQPDFRRRQSAMTMLQTIPPEAIPALVDAASDRSTAESARRVFELLENFYIASEDVRAGVAAEELEHSLTSDRWMIVELARNILDRNWRIRVTRSLHELQTLGANIKPGDPDDLWRRTNDAPVVFFGQGFPDDQLRISITAAWKGQERGMELITRLSPLVERESRLREVRLGIYLIDGHPLSDDEVSRLKATFGDRRVVTRGVVCLGITADPAQLEDVGCRIGSVAPGSSAGDAGLMQGDLIVRLDDVDVKDFDHLVDLLRKYRLGDEVTMSVRRVLGPRSGPDLLERPLQDVPVILKGWKDLE